MYHRNITLKLYVCVIGETGSGKGISYDKNGSIYRSRSLELAHEYAASCSSST